MAATDLTIGALTIVDVSAGGYYQQDDRQPGAMRYRNIRLPNVAYQELRALGAQQDPGTQETYVFSGYAIASSEANIKTLITTATTYLNTAALQKSTLAFAQPKHTGSARSLTNMRMVAFNILSPLIDRVEDTNWAIHFSATFARYGT